MSERLRFEVETTHVESVVGRIVSADLSFSILVGNGTYRVTLEQDRESTEHAMRILTIHGGTLPELIASLTEIHELYAQAVGRHSAATKHVE